jgi:hypothetical protein
MRLLVAAAHEPLLLAQMRNAATSAILLLSGDKRKWRKDCQTDANDPERTMGLISVSGRLCAISYSPIDHKVVGSSIKRGVFSGGHMHRREFVTLIGATATWPLTARAQRAKVARIGFLGVAPASAWADQVEAFKAGLHDLGYIEGRNIVIEQRWAESPDQLSALAAELVRMNVDIVVAPASTEVEPA